MQVSNNIIVSVIIASYNREKFIGEAVQSILDQTFTNFEIILIDDGSTDKTGNIIKEFNDPRINYYYQSNKGRSNARNYAISKAQGKYITFLDSDDLYLPDKIGIQVDFLNKHHNMSMVYTSAHCIDEDGNPIAHKYHATSSGWIYEKIAFFVPLTITLPTVMVRKEVFDHVGLFDENMYRFEDTDMWRRISKHYEIGAIPIFTCKLRTHSDNTLVTQNPAGIVSAIKYYSLKILSEDKELGTNNLELGIARLYNHYGWALSSVPEFADMGKELIRIAQIFSLNEIVNHNQGDEPKKYSGFFYYLFKIYYKTPIYKLDQYCWKFFKSIYYQLLDNAKKLK